MSNEWMAHVTISPYNFVVAPQTSQDASVLTDSSGGTRVDGYPFFFKNVDFLDPLEVWDSRSFPGLGVAS
jgi:hypothetical protein